MEIFIALLVNIIMNMVYPHVATLLLQRAVTIYNATNIIPACQFCFKSGMLNIVAFTQF